VSIAERAPQEFSEEELVPRLMSQLLLQILILQIQAYLENPVDFTVWQQKRTGIDNSFAFSLLPQLI
jgi:hypothetical protein